MARKSVALITAGILFLVVLGPAAAAKGPKPKPEPVMSLTLSCDWAPVPEGEWPPIPAPHLDATVSWENIGNRATLSIEAGDVVDGLRRGWGGHREILRRQSSGSSELHLDVWIEPGDLLWATATISNSKHILVGADVELGC